MRSPKGSNCKYIFVPSPPEYYPPVLFQVAVQRWEFQADVEGKKLPQRCMYHPIHIPQTEPLSVVTHSCEGTRKYSMELGSHWFSRKCSYPCRKNTVCGNGQQSAIVCPSGRPITAIPSISAQGCSSLGDPARLHSVTSGTQSQEFFHDARPFLGERGGDGLGSIVSV